jgi:hypothetical protein
MMMKNKIVHGFDHTANWIAKVRNVSRPGEPIVLDLVPHLRRVRGRAKKQDAAQLLANRESLLRRQNRAGMLSSGTDPLGV